MRWSADGSLSCLTSLLYRAVVDPALWENALTAVCEHMHAAALTLLVVNLVSRTLTHVRNVGYAAEALDAYRTCYAAQDPRWRRIALAPPRQVLQGDSISVSGFDEPFRQWHQQSAGHAYFAGMNFPIADDTVAVLLAEYRQPGEKQWQARLVENLESLLQILEPAVRASARTVFADPAATVAAELVNRSRSAIVVVDGRGQVTQVNEAMAALLEDGDLVIEKGSLRSTLRASQNALEGFIQFCAKPSVDAVAPVLLLWRRSGKRPYVVRALVPRRLDGRRAPGERTVALLVTDSAREARLNRHELALLFQLTERQVELAVLLSGGHSLIEAAEAMGIKEKTARTHLECILRKTHTRRQSELVSLLLSYRSPVFV